MQARDREERHMAGKLEIMLLDDEPIVCDRLQEFLEKRSMSVESYYESQRAIERIKEKDFDVIVADLRMEGPTGIDVLNVVKQGGHKSEVIIITGYGSFESYREAELGGVYDFICKPFQMEDIYKLIKKAARKARKKK
jgi:DNA-binding NtrC family response regulator